MHFNLTSQMGPEVAELSLTATFMMGEVGGRAEGSTGVKLSKPLANIFALFQSLASLAVNGL